MILVKPSFEIWTPLVVIPTALIQLEKAGRVCYKSEPKGDWLATKKFVESLVKRGHESVIEHFSITVLLIVDRGVTHELVRHRLASYSQESTRYCNYSGGVTFVIPPWTKFVPGTYNGASDCHSSNLGPDWEEIGLEDRIWFCQMLNSETEYQRLLKGATTEHWQVQKGWTPQQARSVLPNSLKTEIVMTANLREWRHVFKLRTAPAAHPQMREIMIPLLAEFKKLVPVVFDDVEPK
jgi:thymidylate synthase (FAD)